MQNCVAFLALTNVGVGALFSLKWNRKSWIFLVLILGISVLGLGAEEAVRWTWNSQDGKISWFRYQLNAQEEDGWTLVDASVTSVVLSVQDMLQSLPQSVAEDSVSGEGNASQDVVLTLYVQSSYDGVLWSQSGCSTYVLKRGASVQSEQNQQNQSAQPAQPTEGSTENLTASNSKTTETGVESATSTSATSTIEAPFYPEFSARLSVGPYSVALYRFFNGYETASSKTKTDSKYACSVTAEFDFDILSWLRLYPEVGYSFVVKESTVIPGQRNVHYIKAGAGVDFTLRAADGTGAKATASATARASSTNASAASANTTITSKNNTSTSVYLGILGGVMGHINNNKASIAPYFGARAGLDFKVSQHLYIGTMTRVTFALFVGRTSDLMNSMTVLVDPLSITLTYKI